jgi:predicted CoA-binding protein
MTEPREVLEKYSKVAVVGASANEEKPPGYVPVFLRSIGWDVTPVNPKGDEILGRPAARSLAEVEGPVEVVDVFRPAEEAPDIARQAVAAGAKALWLQLGITSPEARRIAEEAGLDYVEDACMKEQSQATGIRKG